MTSQRFKRFKHLICALVALGGAAAVADTNAPAVKIRFDGDSTLHGFGGTVTASEVVLIEKPGEAPAIRGKVNVLEMVTGHQGRDRKMYEMFDAAHFPEIIGEVSANDWALVGSMETMPVRLIICNQTNMLNALVHKNPEAAPGDPVALDFAVSLSAFNLQAPSVMGLIKVKDLVRVHVELNPIKMSGATIAKENPL